MKKIFIVGAGGYIGTKMVPYLLNRGHQIVAFDRFYFGDTLAEFKNNKKITVVKGDIRDIEKKHLKGVDFVINLASISNDPSSDLLPQATKEINEEAAISLARLAKKMGVKRYIFSSSCSVYGAGEGILSEKSSTKPLSIYAKTKIAAENEILKLGDKNFCTTVLRLATVYGLSKNRMRFDLVINLMTLHAWKNKKLFILGGGKQWRPLIHVDDVVLAFDGALNAPKVRVNKEIINIGSENQTHQVFQIANIIKKHFPDITIETTPDDPDQRSYRVDFKKCRKILGFVPKKKIEDGIIEIRDALETGKVSDDIKTNTSWYYKYLLEANDAITSIKLNGKLF